MLGDRRWAIVVLFGLIPLSAWGQDKQTILNRVAQSRLKWSEIFAGQTVQSRQYVVRPGESTEKQVLFESTFHQLAPNVWRCDVIHGNEELSFVRDGGFAFDVRKKAGSPTYQFGRLGFDQHVHDAVAESMLVRNSLAMNPSHVFSEDLVDFLSIPTVSIQSVEKKTVLGRAAERVRWTMAPFGDQFPRAASGELVWLPEEGYLLERVVFRFDDTGATTSDADAADGAAMEFQFENDFDLQSDLIPIKTRWAEPAVEYVTELVSRAPLAHGRDFFRAEAFGLSTPTNPNLWRLLWLGFGLLFLLSAFYIWNRAGRPFFLKRT